MSYLGQHFQSRMADRYNPKTKQSDAHNLKEIASPPALASNIARALFISLRGM